ncbi:MAG: hypothetical protein JSV52_06660 [Candidatus Zixiibacteriota bacterium]|nr:MAG: hypothetical protein JSV52_06660 [candidate division Zixibacteria bacterium]
MFRQIISLVTLAAFLFNSVVISGCTRIVKIPAGTINQEQPGKITRLKFLDGGNLVWNTDGARYHYREKLFDGVTSDGEPHQVRLVSVDTVYVTVKNDTVEHATDPEAFHEKEVKRWRNTIKGRIHGFTNEEGKVTFYKSTGWIDTTGQFIVGGITESGDTLQTPLSEIDTLEVKRSAPDKTFLAVLGLGALAFLITAIIAGATMTGFGSGTSY